MYVHMYGQAITKITADRRQKTDNKAARVK